MQYKEYSYLYPPRASTKINPKDLAIYDNGKYIAQPKYNGSCAVLFMNEDGHQLMNRHKELLAFHNTVNFQAAYKGSGFMVLCGEYLNKSQAGENGQPFNHKFIIWDILVFESTYLINTSVETRLDLLEALYPASRSIVRANGNLEMHEHILCTEHENIYKAPTYLNNFTDLNNELIQTPLYEGIVLKRKDALLQLGYHEKNNDSWQVKCRKTTRNYKF